LCRMLMRAVTGGDDWRVADSGEMVVRTGHGVAHDDAVRRHGFEVSRHVEKCLALTHAGGGNTDVNGVSRKPFGGNFKGSASASGRFKKKVDNGAAAKGRHLFYLATGDVAKVLGRVEQMRNLAGFEFADTKQVFSGEIHF
jgi:hypothetical protein